MAGTFPTISSGQVCMYPVKRTVAAPVRVLTMEDGSEQRWRSAPILSAWELQYQRLSLTDVDTIRAFFETQKGAYDATWTFPFDGASYSYLCFDQDELSWVENPLKQFALTLRIRQVKRSGTYSGSGTATYPTISTGAITQLPLTSGLRHLTTRNDMDSGLRFARSERDTPLRFWQCSYPVITSAEAATLMDFFTAMSGKHRAFTFTDPNTAVEYTARFAQDQFERRFVSKNHNSVTLQIEEVAA